MGTGIRTHFVQCQGSEMGQKSMLETWSIGLNISVIESFTHEYKKQPEN